MKYTIDWTLCSVVFCFACMQIYAQSQYDPHKAFDPNFDNGSKSVYRSSDGYPGPGYWQNRADYMLDAQLDTTTNVVTCTARIIYTNNSPNELPYLWLSLDQNQFNAESRSARISSTPSTFSGGFVIKEVGIRQKGRSEKVEYLINDTRMQVRLPEPMKAHGDKLELTIRYSFPIAPSGMGRSGFLRTEHGTIYDIAQWYPRMQVYDDITGWNNLAFLGGGEFYLEYGTIDYRVTVPADLLVIGSGTLLNPKSVLANVDLERLARARKSDSTVAIRTLSDVMSRENRTSGMRTWHYHMENTRDVVWAASRAFLWDAARINLPGGKSSLAIAAYPAESAKDTTWLRCVQYLKQSVEIFSRDWYPYPYDVAGAVGGPVGGMEYPAVIFGSWKASRKGMWIIANHEIGHEWFPMIVGSNERVDAWMDEGFNTFIDIYATEKFNGGEFAPKRDNEYAPKGGDPAREIVAYLKSPDSQPVISYADAIPNKYVHPLEYYKAALGLVLLREDILGPDRFDYAFKTYIRRWAYKHPTPFDFFRAMNNAAGENLNWFWKGWFVENWKLDQAIKEVKYVNDDPTKGALITVVNNDQMVMPLSVKYTEENGHTETRKFPVEVWERSGEFTFRCNSTSKLTSVVVDPEEKLPDVDTTNNVWTAKR